MTPVQLPEVPEWSGDFMTESEFREAARAYATEAVMAERARLAGLLSRTIRDAVFKNFDQSASRYKVITGPSTIALSVQVEVLALLTPIGDQQ